MESPLAWWVLRRDVSGLVEVRGEPTVFASMIVDSRGVIAGVHAAREAAESLQIALKDAAQRSRSERPAMVLCPVGLGHEVGEALTRLKIRAPVVEDEPPDGVEDIFDALLGDLAGRRQSSDPPTPDEWRTLHAEAQRFLLQRPWERWPGYTDIPLQVELDGTVEHVYALLLVEDDGAPLGLGVTREPGKGSSPTPPPGSAVLSLESVDVQRNLVARGERYGWPAGLWPIPIFVAFDAEGTHELDGGDARTLSAAVAALLELDAQTPSPSVADQPPSRSGRGRGRARAQPAASGGTAGPESALADLD